MSLHCMRLQQQHYYWMRLNFMSPLASWAQLAKKWMVTSSYIFFSSGSSKSFNSTWRVGWMGGCAWSSCDPALGQRNLLFCMRSDAKAPHTELPWCSFMRGVSSNPSLKKSKLKIKYSHQMIGDDKTRQHTYNFPHQHRNTYKSIHVTLQIDVNLSV